MSFSGDRCVFWVCECLCGQVIYSEYISFDRGPVVCSGDVSLGRGSVVHSGM